MAKSNLFPCIFMLFLCVGICKGDWCVVKSTASNRLMQVFLDAACAKMDCSAINPGGSCYEPNNYRNHCAYALNLNYRRTGVCAGIGTKSLNDPSYGQCHYT